MEADGVDDRDAQPLHRCAHCRGFYEASRAACKWCAYETPMLRPDGEPMVFADRAAARAVQVAEYERLPKAAHDDPMRPPMNMPGLLCGCLHCGPGGEVFEAVEMRWIVNEDMWACPCTTCGGRGYGVDIHSVEPIWQCAECGHLYKPVKFTSAYANCPECGSKFANGWYEDDGEDDELDEELWEAEDEEFAAGSQGDAIPWSEPAETVDWAAETTPWYPGKEEDEERAELEEYRERMPDDIDFPRDFRKDGSGPGSLPKLNEDDIPF